MCTVFVLDFQLDRKFERGDTWREAVTRAQRVLNNGYFTNSLIGTESVLAGLTRKPPLPSNAAFVNITNVATSWRCCQVPTSLFTSRARRKTTPRHLSVDQRTHVLRSLLRLSLLKFTTFNTHDAIVWEAFQRGPRGLVCSIWRQILFIFITLKGDLNVGYPKVYCTTSRRSFRSRLFNITFGIPNTFGGSIKNR